MKRNTYSREELEDTVKSYLEMRQKEINGESFIKKKYTKNLLKNSPDLKSLMNSKCKIFHMFFQLPVEIG